MRVGQVIGTVTLSQADPGLAPARLLLVNPLAADTFATACANPPALSDEPTLVAYDMLGTSEGSIVGFVEGGEATAPFDRPAPVDALIIALFDHIEHHPA